MSVTMLVRGRKRGFGTESSIAHSADPKFGGLSASANANALLSQQM
jgi:hypothetical protein